MTKLRARQAEVTKEVQNAPAAGARPIPFEPQPSQEDINARSIFVTNVHFAATQAALRVHLGRCGNINRVTMLVEPATGKPKGSAYVEFTSQEAVESALAMNDTALLSRNLKVMRKSSTVVDMNPISVPPHSFSQPPFSRGYPTPHSLYIPARRPMALPMVHMGTSNLKWKRDASAGSGTPSTGTPPADVEMIHTGPVRFSRSLSYVRVAPYPAQVTSTAEAQKT
jgi:RNA recognition motif-containing protein